MTKIDIVDWVHTRRSLRFLRAILATSIAFVIEQFFVEMIPDADWLVTDIIPELTIGFVIFGPFVLLCERIGLISEYNQDED